MLRVSDRRRWLALALLAAGVATALPAAADRHDCTYDQDDQVRVVREVAARHPGGKVDEKDRREGESDPPSRFGYTKHRASR